MDSTSWVQMAWTLTKDGDPVGLSLFRRHYTYRRSRDQFDMFNVDRNRNMSLFVGPGEKPKRPESIHRWSYWLDLRNEGG